jgi:hypothetical protein
MILDNKKATYNIWLVKFISTVIFFPLVSVISFSYFFTGPVLGLERTHYILIACALYIGIMVYYTLKHPYFIFYSDRSEKIVLRYYPIKALNQKKQSIEIPKSQFLKYETEKFFLGNEKLFLFQRYNNKVAKFPAISLSALTKKEIQQIKASLNQYVKNTLP